MRQGALTVLAPIRPEKGELQALRRCFEGIRRAVNRYEGAGSALGFERVKTLHFARFVILEDPPPRAGEDPGGAILLLSTQHDGPRAAHLEELIAEGEEALAEILSHCSGFDAEEGPSDRRIFHYLMDRAHRAHAFYAGTPRRSLGRILWEEEVAGWIRKSAADLPSNVDPTEAWRRIREEVRQRLARERPAAEATHGPECAESAHWVRFQKRTSRIWRVVWNLVWILPLGTYYLFPWQTVLVVLGLVVVGLRLRIEEEREAEALERREASASHVGRNEKLMAHERALRKHENLWSQNQLTVASTVKDSGLRRALLRVVLAVIYVRARFKFTQGLLHDLPTIHSAYWMTFDRNRRLLFVSNYDGGWSGYLDEFVLHAPMALTAIWTHAEGFPATRLMFWGGGADGPRFKAWARSDQAPPEVWYSAYPRLSTENINRNSELVEGLGYRGFADPGRRDETLEWLSKI